MIKPYLVTASSPNWSTSREFVLSFMAAECTESEAADRAGISTRQLRRWASELLHEHFEMTLKDLLSLTQARRRRLAQKVAQAEDIRHPAPDE